MKTTLECPERAMRGKAGQGAPPVNRAFMLTECLVYIGLLFVVLGAGYLAMDRCIDNSLVLRRNADDIASALRAGERWRADVRTASAGTRLENSEDSQTLVLSGARGETAYRFSTNAVLRRVGQGPWVRLLGNVKSSAMQSDPRQRVTAWRWELELQPRAKASVKASRIRPLFTFLAVPASL
jgi:hypothetical protein